MYNLNRFVLLLFIFLGFQLSSIAQDKQSVIKQLSKKADVILTGKVTQKKSSWNDSKTRIYTKTTVQVEEYLKGNTRENSIEITYPGGEVGDVGEIYTHMPRFENNEEVLVFLKKDKKNDGYQVLFGEEGKITMINDEKTNKKVTASNLPINDLKSQIISFISKNNN
jgi:hypothetical protein